MKLYIAALFAAVAFAQQDTSPTVEEGENTDVPDEVVTQLAWTAEDSQQNTNSRWWTYLSQSDKPQGLPLETSGDLTCSTDADGVTTLKSSLRGSWALQWRQTSGSNNNDAFTAGLVFSIGQTDVKNGVSTTTGEYWATGGKRNKQDRENLPLNGDALTQDFFSRAIVNGESLAEMTWEYDASYFEAPQDGPAPLWTLQYARTVEAANAGKKYIQGIEASASRPFTETDYDFNLKNLETYDVGAGVWVYDTNARKLVNSAWGTQEWKIDMPVPKPEPKKELCPDGTEKVEGQECNNAIALGMSVLTAAAMLLVSF